MSTSVQSLPSNLTAPAPTPAVSGNGGASQDEFLKLLVAQLAHQDPLDPQKGADFVAQLAQFSSLEQATQMNNQLSALATAQMSSQRASLAGFIGKSVTATTNSVTLGATGAPTISAHLEGASSVTKLTVSDINGNTVRTMDLGPRMTGDSAIAWDGTDDRGHRLAPGTYNVSVTAAAPDGSSVPAAAAVQGLVSAVEFPASGNPVFRVGGAAVAPGNITSVND